MGSMMLVWASPHGLGNPPEPDKGALPIRLRQSATPPPKRAPATTPRYR